MNQDIRLETISARSRYAAIIAQRISPKRHDEYMEWQRAITSAAAKFPGYEKTEVFEPYSDTDPDWITMVHFNNSENLEKWLASDERRFWTKEFIATFGEYRLQRLGGLASWFSSVAGSEPVPGWRIALTVVLTLYPTVMLLTKWVSPALASLPFAVVMLLSNMISVAMLQWLFMPVVTRALGFWLQPSRSIGIGRTVAGFVGIAAALAAMTWAFVRFG